MPFSVKEMPLLIDGSHLKAGGQVLRNAITLSALTSRPIKIHSVRKNRPDSQGLKTSHVQTIECLAQMSNSLVQGTSRGSMSFSFYPPENINSAIKMEYRDIKAQGSVFLVLQAVYPYLLQAGGLAEVEGPICVGIRGWTNLRDGPSPEFMSQVFVPNMKRLGYPEMQIEVLERQWYKGSPRLGSVKCLINPLPSTRGPDGKVNCHFPPLNLDQYQRGRVTKIDITVLAPDDEVFWPTRVFGKKENLTIRKLIEQEITSRLVRLKLPEHIYDRRSPIAIHTSERTFHHTHVYILIVAHTDTGFRLSCDVCHKPKGYIFSPDPKDESRQRYSYIKELLDLCTVKFAMELYNTFYEKYKPREGIHRSCVDSSMRNQLAIFEALGQLNPVRESKNEDKDERKDKTILSHCRSLKTALASWKKRPEMKTIEDDRYWCLHMKSARWVCGEVLGIKLA